MRPELKIDLILLLLGVILGASLFYLKGVYFEGKKLSPISESMSIFSFFKETPKPKKIIYGYLPYWSLNQIEYLQLDKLTDIAYFGLYLNPDGSFTEEIESEEGELISEPGYLNWKENEELEDLIERSNKNGVRFSLTVISHIDETSDAFLDCRECWDTFAQNLITELDSKGIRDVNLNFEYVEFTDGDRPQKYSDFVKFLNTELDKTYGNSFLVVSTFADALVKPRITDVESLSTRADALFIMAYDFHRPTSDNAGPVAPIDGKGVHAEYDINTMLADYFTVSPPNKLIMGVPYYGYNWVVKEDVEYAERMEGSDLMGYSQSQTYAAIMDNILELEPEVKWDELGETPYFTYISPETEAIREVYFENRDSLEIKYNLINSYELGGVGIWALGYDEGYVELWNLLSKEFLE
jgi:spore germination protein YaaH